MTINHEKNTNNNSVAHIFKFSKIKMRCQARAVKWVSGIRTRTDLRNWGSTISDGCLSQYWVVNELSAQSWEPWLAALWNGGWSHSGKSKETDHLPWDRRSPVRNSKPCITHVDGDSELEFSSRYQNPQPKTNMHYWFRTVKSIGHY